MDIILQHLQVPIFCALSVYCTPAAMLSTTTVNGSVENMKMMIQRRKKRTIVSQVSNTGTAMTLD